MLLFLPDFSSSIVVHAKAKKCCNKNTQVIIQSQPLRLYYNSTIVQCIMHFVPYKCDRIICKEIIYIKTRGITCTSLFCVNLRMTLPLPQSTRHTVLPPHVATVLVVSPSLSLSGSNAAHQIRVRLSVGSLRPNPLRRASRSPKWQRKKWTGS